MTTHTLAFESLLDPSNEVRKAAEAAFHALRESEPALVCTQLVAGLAHGPQVRQLCAVLLRRYLPAMGPQISREMWEAVKAGLLQALAAEPDAAQRRKLCDAVGRLGAEFYVDGNWPELAQFISGACTAGEPAAHEAAITIVAHMAPALVEPDAWAQHGGPLTGMLVAALDNFAQPAVQGAALSALATLLRNAAEASEANKGKDEVRKAKAVVASMAHVLGKMLGVLEGAVNAGEAGRMLGVVQDISDVAGAAPRLFKMLLPQVLEGMAALATSPLAADVRVACAELLMTLAEGAPKMVAKLPQYGGRVLSVLVPMMVNLEGLQPTSYCHLPSRLPHHLLPLLQVNLNPDASDWEEAEPDDGLDADDEEDEADRESSYAKEGLDRLCEAMDGEAIVELLLPQLQGMLGPQASWQQRHASLVAIAQVAEHGGPKLEPHLPALMNLAAAAASDAHPRLRWAAFYCAGLLCDQFPALAEEQSEALVPLLLGGAADACSRVQAAACLAGVNLVEAMPEEVAAAHHQPLLTALHATLSGNCPSYVAYTAASLLAVVATAVGKPVGAAYGAFMPLLKARLGAAIGEKRRKLTGALLNAAGCLALAAGAEAFGADAGEMVPAMVSLLAAPETREDNDLRVGIHASLAKMAEALGARFEPYLASIVPPLLAHAAHDVGIEATRVEERDGQDDDGINEVHYAPAPGGRGLVKLVVNKAQLEEKITALQVTRRHCCHHHTLHHHQPPHLTTPPPGALRVRGGRRRVVRAVRPARRRARRGRGRVQVPPERARGGGACPRRLLQGPRRRRARRPADHGRARRPAPRRSDEAVGDGAQPRA